MKNIILILTFIISGPLLAEVVAPSSWWQEENIDGKLNSENESLFKVTSILDEVFAVQNEVLTERQNKQSRFRLSEYTSGFSVSKSGLFGLSALKAKQSVEVFWKKNEIKEEQLEQKSISMFYSNDQKIIGFQLAQIADIVLLASSVYDLSEFKLNLKKYFKDINTMFSEISGNQWKNWRFDGIRSDLYILADGSISYIATASVALRVRIEWKWQPSIQKETKTNLSKLITNLLEDLDYILAENTHENFDLSKAYVGIGYTAGLRFFGLASANYSLMGYARFVKIDDQLIEDLASNEDIYEVTREIGTEKGLINFFKIKRNKWRAGLRKALNMSKPFLTAAGEKFQTWSIYKVRTSFQLSYQGWLGFSSRGSNAGLELEFKEKKHMIEPLYVLAPRKDSVKRDWTLTTLRVRGQLKVGIEIPYIVNAKIYPELEFFWVR